MVLCTLFINLSHDVMEGGTTDKKLVHRKGIADRGTMNPSNSKNPLQPLSYLMIRFSGYVPFTLTSRWQPSASFPLGWTGTKSLTGTPGVGMTPPVLVHINARRWVHTYRMAHRIYRMGLLAGLTKEHRSLHDHTQTAILFILCRPRFAPTCTWFRIPHM